MSVSDFDVLIGGAGLSGIGAANHLQDKCPDKTFAILEGRGASGGTWDLFRYPGVRSDSDMHTMGYHRHSDFRLFAIVPTLMCPYRESLKAAQLHISPGA